MQAEAALAAEASGDALRSGLNAQARSVGLGDDFKQSGPSQMPYFHFDSEKSEPLSERAKILTFCSHCAKRGIIFHPFHTMFLCGAHRLSDIQATLEVTKGAFKEVASLTASDASHSKL